MRWVSHGWRDEAGAVTIDWVVLAAIAAALALVTIPPVVLSLTGLATDMSTTLEEAEVAEITLPE